MGSSRGLRGGLPGGEPEVLTMRLREPAGVVAAGDGPEAAAQGLAVHRVGGPEHRLAQHGVHRFVLLREDIGDGLDHRPVRVLRGEVFLRQAGGRRRAFRREARR